jgi:YidC/Oxa1 family membrane protein insertase
MLWACGCFEEDGTIHWDVVGMILAFGISLYVNQLLSGQNSPDAAPQQATVNKITPILFSGMFLFFPLPAGVLMYMLIANIFQTAQTFILMREPLPENIQKMMEQQEKKKKPKSLGSVERHCLLNGVPRKRLQVNYEQSAHAAWSAVA